MNQIDSDDNMPARTIFFSIDDYTSFEENLKRDKRARFLFIQGRKVVDVDHRSADSRDKRLCIGKYTLKGLPHYEGLISRINKVAFEYEQSVSKI